MKIGNEDIYNKSASILKDLYGEAASFRDGQYEAIEATMTHKRTLVVQKTGWGKSLVYFICTKLMRMQNKGVTVVVSPLLVLMQNQIEAANKLGLKCEVLNSTVRDRREEIIYALENDEIDLLLVTPETLFRDDVQSRVGNIKIGLFVIDEVHCISDWGHDFRLEYSRLKDVISILPLSTPVLGTTATASERVVSDLKKQFGNDVYISRGPLSRESLNIQILHLRNKAERYAWILQNIEKLDGSGIIYCLTQRDCDYLADFLKNNGIKAEAYYSRKDKDGETANALIEEKFRKNEIKAVVATVKLGMGYDKGDISFVIHYQMPMNIVSYYQQIGRAGRKIDNAYIFLMFGQEDEEINNYFIDTAFPSETETNNIIEVVKNSNGISVNGILEQINIRKARADKALMFLVNDGFIRKDGAKYYLNPKPYFYDKEHYDNISNIKRQEMAQMKELTTTKMCYNKFIVNCLDDNTATNCGKCSNCLGREILGSNISKDYYEKALRYIECLIIPITPRKLWPVGSVFGYKKIRFVNGEGICLSKYGDAGYGELVKRDKYSRSEVFCDELLGKSAKILKQFVEEKKIKAVTCVPSLRSNIVKDFSERLAKKLNLPFYDLLDKTQASRQKNMENSTHQCNNAFDSFYLKNGAFVPKSVLLVDDVVDSGWTLTVCGYKLMENGCEEVFPFALADSSQREG